MLCPAQGPASCSVARSALATSRAGAPHIPAIPVEAFMESVHRVGMEQALQERAEVAGWVVGSDFWLRCWLASRVRSLGRGWTSRAAWWPLSWLLSLGGWGRRSAISQFSRHISGVMNVSDKRAGGSSSTFRFPWRSHPDGEDPGSVCAARQADPETPGEGCGKRWHAAPRY